MTFDEWWDTTKAASTPETFAGWEHSCRQAWAAAVAAERERCEKELAYIGTRAESFAKRADDCGCLSRLILKALDAIRAG